MKKYKPTRLRQKAKFIFDLAFTERIRRHVLQALPFWLASLLTGLIAVAYTKLFALSEGVLQASIHRFSWSLFIIAPVCFLLAWAVVVWFSPNAKGSGIPQVMAAIELSGPKHHALIDKLLSLRIVVTKLLSSLLMVLGGGAIGREGPTIQIASSVFLLINRKIPASWPKLSRQSFILTGAAAGLAAAFNTPLGGVVFAMEELAKIHVRFFRTALFSAVIIAGLTAQAFLGPYLYLGYPDVKNLHFSILFGVIATAVLSGLLGGFMCKGILRIMRWKRKFSAFKKGLFIVGAGLFFAAVAFFWNNEVLGSGKELMNQLLFNTQKTTSLSTVLLRIAGPMICFNTGAAGGVFAPSLASGAAIGAYMAQLFDIMGANANILILCGMVGFLTGVTRTPFTSAILVLEMTDRHSVIFHLMIAALVANIAALLVDRHSFYEVLKKDYVADVTTEEAEPNPPAVPVT